MSKILKIWLWVVLVTSSLAEFLNLVAAFLSPTFLINVVLTGCTIVGVALLLFKQKKVGFYIVCGGQLIYLLIIIALNISSLTVLSLLATALNAFLTPALIYVLMKPCWNEFH